MSVTNPLNVFKGADSIKQFFNPDEQPPVPLVELPPKLNPFHADGVRIYAKLLTCLPAQNVKALPALNMLLNDPSSANKSVVEVSSGSTVTSLAIAARVLYDNDNSTAYVSNKAALDRVRELQFYGLKVDLYGGPTYTETTDPRGPVEWARGLGKRSDKVVNLGQYDNEHNWKSHERWTGPQIWRQLPEINVFCMGMGSTGCVTGTGKYLKAQKESVKVIGVCNAEADIIPGPREKPMHKTSPFPWKDVVDFLEVASSEDSYRLSLRLSREGIIAGPSSGMALQGLFEFAQREKDNGTLGNYADPETGEVSCVFVCCDLPQKHIETYFKKLGPEEFKPIGNQELFKVDQNVYSFRWEIDPQEILDSMPEITNGVTGSPAVRFLDLRSQADFESGHVKGAFNAHLPGLSADTITPFNFDEINTLVEQSKRLEELLQEQAISDWISNDGPPIVVVDYNGDTSRILVAALRAKGVEAYTFIDGVPGLQKYLDSLRS
ncbi:tryptophan synthase beta subunit-like PLP-dependent enzyme [Aspergillus steynii IBT 23096]|uniref:Tryptophan synthase beta subunit-like PLP-dependent enzyme n=1 Tax=Aspergillus steynii IBT 23096 TaxID=1392250 RepID=A0A2I2GS47_9EURO|nr:tryptophan synthase beta subunit-like PLP-dependent enzyme [Aspergillus steynii IBT 23096]PLB55683.1 tryptophan synthase beta subunit-like PLP-dependent enzyme [Aspergillus steynii IBT 23096]